jgi:hypothetical protein
LSRPHRLSLEVLPAGAGPADQVPSSPRSLVPPWPGLSWLHRLSLERCRPGQGLSRSLPLAQKGEREIMTRCQARWSPGAALGSALGQPEASTLRSWSLNRWANFPVLRGPGPPVDPRRPGGPRAGGRCPGGASPPVGHGGGRPGPAGSLNLCPWPLTCWARALAPRGLGRPADPRRPGGSREGGR